MYFGNVEKHRAHPHSTTSKTRIGTCFIYVYSWSGILRLFNDGLSSVKFKPRDCIRVQTAASSQCAFLLSLLPHPFSFPLVLLYIPFSISPIFPSNSILPAFFFFLYFISPVFSTCLPLYFSSPSSLYLLLLITLHLIISPYSLYILSVFLSPSYSSAYSLSFFSTISSYCLYTTFVILSPLLFLFLFF
jgi:hypothetical protein